MEKFSAFIVKHRSRITILILLITLTVLGGYTGYEILRPIDPTTSDKLEEQILGKKITFDKNVIEKVEKRRDYGRVLELSYVDQKRDKLKETGTPENFFDGSRLKKFF